MAFGSISNMIYTIKANKAYQSGNTTEALDWLKKAYETGNAKANISTTYGYLLLKTGHLEESLKVFEKLLSSSNITKPERYSIKSNYALALWKKGNLDEAIALYEEIFPNYHNTNIYGSMGFLYILKGDLEKALKFNLEAYDYNNTNGVILDNLGHTYYLMGDYEKADEIFKQLMAINPKFPEAFYDYALVYEKLGNLDKCIEKLRNALAYKTNFLSAVNTELIEAKLAEMESK